LRAFHAGMMAELPQALEAGEDIRIALDNNVIIKGRIDQINALGTSETWKSWITRRDVRKRMRTREKIYS